MKALLSIKPEFAFQIFAGNKRFEYRRKIFKQPVDTVVVYVSSPVSMVLGEFKIEDLLFDDLEELWNKTSVHLVFQKKFSINISIKRNMGMQLKSARLPNSIFLSLYSKHME